MYQNKQSNLFIVSLETLAFEFFNEIVKIYVGKEINKIRIDRIDPTVILYFEHERQLKCVTHISCSYIEQK